MIFPFYLVSVALAGGLLGLWARRMLVTAGLLSGFEPGLLVVAAVAGAYAAVELAYLALVRLLKPTSSPTPIVFDMLAQWAALLLLPYLLHLHIPWPWPVLVKLEPILFLGVFAVLHGFLKILVFFSSMQSRPGGRIGALGYAALSGLAALGAFTAQQLLLAGAWDHTLTVAGKSEWRSSGGAWAQAREVREGLSTILPIPAGAGNELLLQYAFNAEDPKNIPDTVHASLILRKENSIKPLAPPILLTLPINPDGWAEYRIPLNALSPDTLEIQWTEKENISWVRHIGLRPAVSSNKSMAFAGPWPINGGESAQRPSVVLIALEGVGSENMSLYGYDRDTTPSLKEHAGAMWTFEQAFTPSPEPIAACMSLLTGVNPLRHGYLNGQNGPIPDDVVPLAERFREQGYLTAAFTEGRGPDEKDLTPGSGFERGFLLFDDHCPLDPAPSAPSSAAPPAPLPGSMQKTINNAGAWMKAHEKDPIFLFLRLRELRTPMRLSRYGEGFLGKGRTPTSMDICDTALLDIDKRLGAFLDQIAQLPNADKRILCLASLYGYDFTEPGRGSWRRGGAARRTLHESSLRVPLLIQAPGQAGRLRKVPVTLCDVAPTLLSFAGLSAPPDLDGADLLFQGDFRECVSVAGAPLALSMRSGPWRFTWQSGRDPKSLLLTGEASVLEFTNVQPAREDQAPPNYLAKKPALAARMQKDLEAYLERRGAPAKKVR